MKGTQTLKSRLSQLALMGLFGVVNVILLTAFLVLSSRQCLVHAQTTTAARDGGSGSLLFTTI